MIIKIVKIKNTKSEKKKYPNYFQLKYANNKSVTAEEIIENLPVATAVVEYFVGWNNIYTFTLSKKGGLQYQVQKKTPELKEKCIVFREVIEACKVESLADFSDVSYFLYDKLLRNELEKLEAKESIKRLLIIPDDYLMQMSFDPLLTEKRVAEPEDELDWMSPEQPFLLRKYAISYAYSNQLLFKNSSSNQIRKALLPYIGFGLKYDDYTLEEFEKLDTSFRKMGRLMNAEIEIEKSAELFTGHYYTNEQATKARFMEEAAEAELLHIAAHGYVLKDEPLNSGLIFTKQKRSSDFVLRAGDIYTMNLKAKMTVLSACHTGDGRIEKGEGIRSLARAFSYAGCPNITASLWGATDGPTKDIIILFYKNVKSGDPIDLALQKAKLEYIDNLMFEKQMLPCNWAHLITIGDVRPIR